MLTKEMNKSFIKHIGVLFNLELLSIIRSSLPIISIIVLIKIEIINIKLSIGKIFLYDITIKILMNF